MENLVEAKLATYHAQNVQRLTRIEERIISIDGNGTGRIGAVQRIENAIANLSDGLADMKESIANVKVDVGGSLKTKAVYAAAASLGVVVLGAIATLAAGWFEHFMGWK